MQDLCLCELVLNIIIKTLTLMMGILLVDKDIDWQRRYRVKAFDE